MVGSNVNLVLLIMGTCLAAAMVVLVYLFVRVRRVERDYAMLSSGASGQNIVEIVGDNIKKTEILTREVYHLSDTYGAVLRRMAGALQHVGVVRFDAFKDIGGRMSFSVALLDERANGIVLSSIYGRSESRTYAKPVVERDSVYELSPEEREAIRLAMQSKEMGSLPMVARDREHEEKMRALKMFQERIGSARAGVIERGGQEIAGGEGIFDVEKMEEDADMPGDRRLFGEEETRRSRPEERGRVVARGNATVESRRRGSSRGLDTPADRLRGGDWRRDTEER